MEVFGILFSFPIAMIASAIYMYLLGKTVRKTRTVSIILIWLSISILLTFSFELICVLVFGSVNIRQTIGPSFYKIHLYLFLATTPAMANLFALRLVFKRSFWIGALACGFIGMTSAVLQYAVSESLFGEDGKSGPYSNEPQYLL
jgi:hypothetical protein